MNHICKEFEERTGLSSSENKTRLTIFRKGFQAGHAYKCDELTQTNTRQAEQIELFKNEIKNVLDQRERGDSKWLIGRLEQLLADNEALQKSETTGEGS